MRVTIHQPEFAPWLGFFDKVRQADQLVLLDDVQFRKNYFHNRNRIRTAQGWSWITVPIARSGLMTKINEVTIIRSKEDRWRSRIKRTVEQSYAKAPAFLPNVEAFYRCLDSAETRLVDLNCCVLKWMVASFDLSPRIIMSSDLDVEGSGSQRILEICTKVGATTYLSGISGRDYLDLNSFSASGIEIEFQKFYHPIYDQLQRDFEPSMSALDALFMMGNDANSLLTEEWPHRMEKLFV